MYRLIDLTEGVIYECEEISPLRHEATMLEGHELVFEKD